MLDCCFGRYDWYKNFEYPDWIKKTSEKVWDEEVIFKVAAAVFAVFITLGVLAVVLPSSPLFITASLFALGAMAFFSFTNYVRTLGANAQETRS